MKAVIAIDSFKGCLSSLQAGDAIREGILRVHSDAVVQVRPLADGGEGTVEALTIGMGGTLQTVNVTGPLGEKADSEYPGTGAAGGMGFAFLSFTNAVLESGIQIVLEETRLEDYVKDADIVITGEGCLDGQTVMGKAPIGVAKTAKKFGKPVVAFAGCVTPEAVACNEEGIDAFFPILRRVVTLSEAMDADNAQRNMADTVEQVFRLMSVKI